MTKTTRILCIATFVAVLAFLVSSGLAADLDRSYTHPEIMANILRQQLENNHYSKKKFDDDLSKAAFQMYLKQLDPLKMFLLTADVERLKAYEDLIDDEMKSGKFELSTLGAEILVRRVKEVEPSMREALSRDFDFSLKEYVETDPEKRSYCATEDELKERWRKILKYQVLNRYLGILDERKPGKEGGEQDVRTPDPGETQKQAREKVLKTYETLFSRMVKEKKTEPFDRYFRAVTKAFDPHTEFLPPATKEDFDIHMKGTLEGIGATLREDDGYIKVESIVPGGPAYLQGGLQANDRITKVAEADSDPVDIVGMRVSDAVRLIRGKKGSVVSLTVLRPNGVESVLSITRDVVQIEETFAKSTILKRAEGTVPIGYLYLPSFYRDFGAGAGGDSRSSADDVRVEIKKLQAEGIKGLVVDLRGNGGGALSDAINIAGAFIKEGPVVQVKNGRGRVTVLADTEGRYKYDGPLAILVNRYSASASEILAGALQDYGRAVIIGGDHTYGKGTVQSVISLSDSMPPWQRAQHGDLGALKLTIQKFYRITGESTQHKGVVPDIALPDMLEDARSGERYLDYALPWDTIAPAGFEKWDKDRISLGSLTERSSGRVHSAGDFETIAAESKKYGEQQKNTLQPLNIDELRRERDEAKRLRDKLARSLKSRIESEHQKDEPRRISPEERYKKWVAEVNEDPYVREAAAVLADMIAQILAQPADVSSSGR